MNVGKLKQNTLFKKSQLSNFKQKTKYSIDHFMIGAFLKTLTQFEKTGLIGKVFIPLGI